MFPHHEGLGDQWRAHLLAAILSLAVLTTPGLILVYFLAAPGFSLDLALLVGVLAFEVSVWLIWRQFGLQPACIILVFGSAFISCGLAFYSGGIASTLLVAQAFVVVMAALLSSARVTAVVVAGLTLFNFSLMNYAETSQLPNLVFNNPPVFRFAVQTALLLITAGTVLYSNRIIRALTQNLANSEYRFRALFEKTSDAVFITGLDLRLIEVNEQAAKMLAYKPAELAGLPVKRLFPADEWEAVQQRFESARVEDPLVPTTRRFVTKTGDELMLETNLSLVEDQEGKPLHYQSTGRDVTQKVMEEQRIKNSLVSMTVKASIDSLTGILNRETIWQHAQAEWERHLREGQPLSVMMLDMDELKKVNDRYGHLLGDQALIAASRTIEKFKRPYDWAGRYGGDEFLIVLPGTSLVDAEAIAKRIENAINQELVRTGKKSVTLSCCLGVASTEGQTPALHSIFELVELADIELYKAKREKG